MAERRPFSLKVPICDFTSFLTSNRLQKLLLAALLMMNGGIRLEMLAYCPIFDLPVHLDMNFEAMGSYDE
jgi:hypothetical protein